MKKVIYKLSILLLAISLVFPTIINPIHTVKADTISTNQTLTAEEQKLADAIQFMFDNAVIYDNKGNVKDINFDVIYQKYGYSDELANLEKTIRYEKTLRANAGHCAVVAIQDTLGVSAVTGLINGGIVGLLKRKASAEIAKLVAKYAFKNLVPGATAAALIWSFGRCMWF